MTAEQRRIGVFGGTFDPPHIAHVVLAAAAVHQLNLDELIVMPAGVPWQKVGSREISPAVTRLRMCNAAFAPVDRVVVSEMEIARAGDTYTVDTLETLSAPGVELHLLLGSDTAAGLDTWHRPEDVAKLASIAVFPRRGQEGEPPPGFEWTLLALPGLEVSSTDLRRRVRSGEPIDGLVPPQVREIVETEGLFGTS